MQREWGAPSFAFPIGPVFPLQLELARPGSSRKVPGAPRRRHKPRRPVSAAGGTGLACREDRTRWTRPGLSRAGSRGTGGGSSGGKSLAQPLCAPSRAPGLASVPQSPRGLQPPAPAHMGATAGGALGILPLTPPLKPAPKPPGHWLPKARLSANGH
ncbi:hypothetical protein P7K49_034318 [Saguinus oedipus]|uniref:Uncharacterized protein n=1 Tax=Saguinus oedipus TaxID=9490 RepID=A0ABQ9TUE2_SAGOE|nr:hypothetical protein P7K49_034318 [Saguinus oedipus]